MITIFGVEFFDDLFWAFFSVQEKVNKTIIISPHVIFFEYIPV
ncbi:hypothetical protein FORMA_02530 [Formosa sp. Hel3_A1_48]|nr:hypothetical protein FORMA_02530 [Formosa sp. Hel3_A1_48]